MLQHAVQAFLIAAVLSPFSYYAGKVANQLRLPQITGYLVSGIISGPYVLGILNQESVTDLTIIEGACLGIIGLAAGAELLLSELNRSKKQVGLQGSRLHRADRVLVAVAVSKCTARLKAG
jgi:NhaP-type Na+/H+ or K+/H+ antiporter